VSRRADITSGNHFANGEWKNRDLAGNACPFPPDSISSDMPTGTHSMRNILLSAATALLAGSTLVGSAHCAELPKGAAHNIVLVHGAFVDQTSWQPVADILTKKGYSVTLVENPLTSLAADVDATKQALAKQDGKTVLVGHSWGGVVITEAGNDPKVSALVYVSAFAPDVGQSLATLANSGPATEGAAAIHPDEGQPLHRSQGVSFSGRG
jgi:pimeloyl-ACP methyl ester carboxylesterase